MASLAAVVQRFPVLDRIRHAIVIVVVATVVVFALEPWLLNGPTPLVGRLSAKDRVELYKQISTVTGILLGFLITAVAVLVSLDVKRSIVQELHRGESFSLLVANLLAAVVLLFVLTTLGIAGAVFDDGASGAPVFEAFWQTSLIASVAESVLGFSFFAVVTYKVAAYN